MAASAWAQEPPEREVFREFSEPMVYGFYTMAFVTVAVFLWGAWRQYRKYMRGKPAPGRTSPFFPRLWEVTKVVASHATINRTDSYAGWAHRLVFWGFVTLIIGTTIVFVDHDFIEPAFGFKTLKGNFYLFFSAWMDLGGLAFLVGLFMLIFRRATFGLPKLDYARVDIADSQSHRSTYKQGDAVFLWLFVGIGITGFLIEASRIAHDKPDFETVSFVGYSSAAVAGPLLANDNVFLTSWWVHVALVFAFIAYLPHSKAMHMITDVISLATRDKKAAIALPAVVDSQQPGIKSMEDFTWRQLLSFDACTKCGRCHDVCPARTTGAPLSPRDLILDLREQSNRSAGMREWFGFSRNAPAEPPESIPGDWISADTLWSCTTCRACVENCPVGIEHVTEIVQMRRTLVDQGIMADSLQEALRSLDEKGNSFGASGRARAKWAKALDFPVKDAAKEPVEMLWFVGDFASYNERCQESSQTFAKVLNAAGIDFGILNKAEKSAGNDVRRVGEEGLFDALASHNIEALGKAEFQRIVTTDPHTYNALKNEYPAFGGEYEVVHYAPLLLELIQSGKLTLQKKVGAKVTYHDPCYLGRYNGIFDEPREVLQACGVEIVEMPRNREQSFCCGAGGGRIWMPDPESATERPSENRIREAVALGVDTFVVACPKDMTMYSDAVKTSGNEGKIVVRDLIEFVAEAVELDNQDQEAANG